MNILLLFFALYKNLEYTITKHITHIAIEVHHISYKNIQSSNNLICVNILGCFTDFIVVNIEFQNIYILSRYLNNIVWKLIKALTTSHKAEGSSYHRFVYYVI